MLKMFSLFNKNLFIFFLPSYHLLFVIFWPHHATCGIEPHAPQPWKLGVLPTGQPGKSPVFSFLKGLLAWVRRTRYLVAACTVLEDFHPPRLMMQNQGWNPAQTFFFRPAWLLCPLDLWISDAVLHGSFSLPNALATSIPRPNSSYPMGRCGLHLFWVHSPLWTFRPSSVLSSLFFQ